MSLYLNKNIEYVMEYTCDGNNTVEIWTVSQRPCNFIDSIEFKYADISIIIHDGHISIESGQGDVIMPIPTGVIAGWAIKGFILPDNWMTI